MDSAQDAQEYDAMDHREVNQQFAQDLLAGGNLVGEVLDLGVGTAQIPIEICQQCSSCKILGIDLADSMLQLGRRRVVSVGMTDRVSLERQDAKQLKYPANRFDAVISRYGRLWWISVLLGRLSKLPVTGIGRGLADFHWSERHSASSFTRSVVEIYTQGQAACWPDGFSSSGGSA